MAGMWVPERLTLLIPSHHRRQAYPQLCLRPSKRSPDNLAGGARPPPCHLGLPQLLLVAAEPVAGPAAAADSGCAVWQGRPRACGGHHKDAGGRAAGRRHSAPRDPQARRLHQRLAMARPRGSTSSGAGRDGCHGRPGGDMRAKRHCRDSNTCVICKRLHRAQRDFHGSGTCAPLQSDHQAEVWSDPIRRPPCPE